MITPLPRAPDTAKNVIISRSVWDRMCDAIEGICKLQVSSPLNIRMIGNVPHIHLSRTAILMLVKLTGTAGVKHSWKQQQAKDDGTTIDFTGGLTGTTTVDAAFELPSDGAFLVDTVTDTGKQLRYIVGSAVESVGQYQYMDRTMVAQGVAGWDFDRLHNLI